MNKKSLFSQLVKQTGRKEGAKLRKIAKEMYDIQLGSDKSGSASGGE